jgi:hypothetical protein
MIVKPSGFSKTVFRHGLFSLALFGLWGFSACDGGNGDQGNIPYVFVNLQIDLNDPAYLDLNPYGGYVYIPNQGNRGLVVYHNFDDTYSCYDRSCSYQVSSSCARLEVEPTGMLLQCGQTENGTYVPCCGSKFLWDGFPADGPALYPLLDYAVYKNGNLLTIANR